ncbi:MAG: Do family serine endopeptidase [Alphaproteobacteria bacterium]|nr:Do family serine endopeptidase [Alphaproteobacteria bacterium]
MLLAAVGIATVAGGVALVHAEDAAPRATAPATAAPTPLAPAPRAAKVVPQDPSFLNYSYAPLIKKVAPAVVNIYTTRMVRNAGPLIFNDPFFQQFFGDRFGGQPQEQRSLGSGVIVRPNGIVVTNHHVIDGADEIVVVLNDRREFKAKVVVDDERSDLAVLKLDTDSTSLPTLQFRDSDSIEVGDVVFAIGNPFGVGQTVTHGIVSAVARTQMGISDYEFFIQTDAAINPGNSGGALVGLDGKLFGINTMILSRSGGSQGVGFAIPANMVARVVDAALNGGKIIRPWFGATGQEITADLADSLGLDRPGGVLINGVYKGGPADRAGLKVGDIVLELDGRQVDSPAALVSLLAVRKVGGEASLHVIRDHKEMTLKVPLVAAPEVPKRDETVLPAHHIFAGAKVANLSPALAEELRVDAMEKGVIVTAIQRGSPAAQRGLRPGDIFVSINGKPVKSVAELNAVWGDYAGEMTVKVKRGDEVITGVFRQ